MSVMIKFRVAKKYFKAAAMGVMFQLRVAGM